MPIADYRTAIVTGASSGIGYAVTTALSGKGIEVYAVARRENRLEQLSNETGCKIHVLDVRDTQRIYETFAALKVDILINNAGHGRGFDALFKVNPEDIDASIDTNVRAAIHMLRAVLPGMVERKCGHVVNMGSMTGLYALKTSVYGSSKGAVHMLSRNLRLELQGTGVKATEICPGRVQSEFYDVAIDDPKLRTQVKESGIRELTPKDVAEAILYALDTPWHVNVNLIELQPTEQTYGGSQFVPLK